MKSVSNYVGIRPLPDNDTIGMFAISDAFEPGRRINNWGIVEVVPNRLVFHDIRKDLPNRHVMSDQQLYELSMKVQESLEIYTGLEIKVGDLVMYPYQYNLDPEKANELLLLPYDVLYACKRNDIITALNGNIFVTKIETKIFDTKCYQGEVVLVGSQPKYLLYDYVPKQVRVGDKVIFEGPLKTPEHENHTHLEDHYGVVSYREIIATT